MTMMKEMTMAHQIQGTNRYCGPAAIALLTGVTTDDAARVARRVSGRRYIKGMHNRDMVASLRCFYGQVFSVNVTGHYVVLVVSAARRVKVGDNKSKSFGPLRGFSGNRKRVKIAWKVTDLNPAAVKREATVVVRRATAARRLWATAKALPGFLSLRDLGDETVIDLEAGYVIKGEGTHGARSLAPTSLERAQDLLDLIVHGTERCDCDECVEHLGEVAATA
jgi:hypothetical protein